MDCTHCEKSLSYNLKMTLTCAFHLNMIMLHDLSVLQLRHSFIIKSFTPFLAQGGEVARCMPREHKKAISRQGPDYDVGSMGIQTKFKERNTKMNPGLVTITTYCCLVLHQVY